MRYSEPPSDRHTQPYNYPMTPGNTFKKAERLSLNNRIEILFASGSTISIYPLKILWLPFTKSLEYPVQVLFTVSSKRFKRAIDRNRIKRKLKEIYRLQKSFLYEGLKKSNTKILMGIMYTGNDQKIPGEALNNKLRQGIEILLRSCDTL